MKALSLIQPWASLVANGAKHWETRSWRTHFRGPVAIHASKGFPGEYRDLCWLEDFATALEFATDRALPLGAIVAVVEITDCLPTSEWLQKHQSYPEEDFGGYGPNRFAWHIENVRKLTTPIPCSGNRGFWNVPNEVEAHLLAQIANPKS